MMTFNQTINPDVQNKTRMHEYVDRYFNKKEPLSVYLYIGTHTQWKCGYTYKRNTDFINAAKRKKCVE